MKTFTFKLGELDKFYCTDIAKDLTMCASSVWQFMRFIGLKRQYKSFRATISMHPQDEKCGWVRGWVYHGIVSFTKPINRSLRAGIGYQLSRALILNASVNGDFWVKVKVGK